jgi:hypothetical protein
MLTLAALTDRVLEELAAAYGARFLRQWDGVTPEAMRRAWARQLAMLSPAMVGWALRHLPEIPPTAPQFRTLALQRPATYTPSLPESRPPPPDKERLAQLLEPIKTRAVRHPRQWAHDLRERERDGEYLTYAQRQMWRAVLPDVPEGDPK